eukprot:8907577-Lingulodinium_polyedra.AAC.1
MAVFPARSRAEDVMARPGTAPLSPEASATAERSVANASATVPITAEAAQQPNLFSGATAPVDPLPWMSWPSVARTPQPDFPPALIDTLMTFAFSPTQKCIVNMLRHAQ